MGASGAVAVERPTAPVLSLVEPVTDPPSFTAVIDDTVGSGDSYQLQVQADGGDWSTLLVDDTDTITSGEDAANQIDATVSALGAGNYDARMRVRDGSGPWSNWSNVVDVVITASEPAYVERGVQSYDGASTAPSLDFDIGDADSARQVWAFLTAQGETPASGVTANGVSLTQVEAHVSGSGTAEVWSGLVTSGSGTVAVIATWPGGAYQVRAVGVITTIGDLEVKDTSTAEGAVSVADGEFVFGAAWRNPGGMTATWSEAPTVETDTISAFFEAYMAHLEATSTNASFATTWSATPYASAAVVVGPPT